MKLIVGIKFRLKLTYLIFWTKVIQKGYFQSKTEKVNTTTEFWIFEFSVQSATKYFSESKNI